MAISGSNQFTTTGFSYDASGNVLADGTNTYAWNAESQIKTAACVNYTYDGDGDRVQKSNGKIYWYGAGSEILDESDSSGNITDEYIFFGGKRIAHRVVSGNTIYYYAEDFLGSSRVMTTSTGTVCYDADFYPYGGERVVTNTCPQNYKFTGKERDADTNNDDFGARYYSPQFGRWISPDWSAIPAPVPFANLSNPQTLNLYAMVRDNPETFADLDGHDLMAPGEYGGNVSLTGPGDFGNPPSVLSTVNNVSDFGENSYYTNSDNNDEDQSSDPGKTKNQTSKSQDQEKKPDPAWDKSKPTPPDPSKLGPDWKKNDDHKHPHGEEWVNVKTGEKMEWNKGRPGAWGPTADRGKDGWHYTPPGGQRSRQIDPGQMVTMAVHVGFWATAVYITVQMIKEIAMACSSGACE